MSSTSDSISWQIWSQKWGDWTTWFQKVDVPLKPLQRGSALPKRPRKAKRSNSKAVKTESLLKLYRFQE